MYIESSFQNLLSTILNNPNLRVVLASIKLLNLSISATNTFKDPKLKNSVSTSGALFQLGQSIAKFYEIKLHFFWIFSSFYARIAGNFYV